MTTVFFIKSGLYAILVLTILITGFFLHKKEKPYNATLMTIHKLTTIAFVVLTIIIAVPYMKEYQLNTFSIVIMVFLVLSIIGLLSSGGLMSIDKNDDTMLLIHRLSTVIFLLSASALAYTLINSIIGN